MVVIVCLASGPGGELAHPQPVLFEERDQHRPVLRPDLTVALHPERLIEDKAAHLAPASGSARTRSERPGSGPPPPRKGGNDR